MSDRVLAYSAIFGAYDDVKAAPPGGGILFTDRAPASRRGWTVILVEPDYPENLARSNRALKLNPRRVVELAGAEELNPTHTLYLDGSMTLRVPPSRVLELFRAEAGRDHDVFTLRHSLGHTAADEPAWVARKGIVDPEVLERQRRRYQDAGVPPDLPIAEARLVVARRSSTADAFFAAWWAEVRDHAHRDQISYPYAVHTTGADVYLYRGAWPPLFRRKNHARPQLRSAT